MSPAQLPATAGRRDEPTARPRSAALSRQRLLEAAGELFAERGYERTTVREIGQRAEVDPAQIARHFGSKAALYLETVRRDGQPPAGTVLALDDAQALQGMLDRLGSRPTPTMYSAVGRHDDPELQAAAQAQLRERLTDPAERTARRADLDHPELRAEIATAALAGVLLSRASKALPHLADASSRDLAQLLAGLLGPLVTADD
jgi:AcrR family transcriptional regulator